MTMQTDHPPVIANKKTAEHALTPRGTPGSPASEESKSGPSVTSNAPPNRDTGNLGTNGGTQTSGQRRGTSNVETSNG